MLKSVFERAGLRVRAGFLMILLLMLGSASVAAQPPVWTLESTVQRVFQEAPSIHAADAQVKAREGDLRQAGVWPNPTFELGASNALGKEDGQGGIDLNQYSVRQPLPLSGRLGAQTKQADASLKQAEAEASQLHLTLEFDAARAFHAVQWHRAQLTLAEQQLQSAEEFQRIGTRREQAGDLSRLERLRLNVVRETAKQLIASTEGELSESLSAFQTLLNLADPDPNLAALDQPPALPELAGLEARLTSHPILVAARHGVEAARHGVEVTRANRFSDPELWLARERSIFGDGRQDVTAFGVSVTLPLWNRGAGSIDAARASQTKAQFELLALQRQLGNQLRLNHLHLGHLIEQAQDYRLLVLAPAEEIFRLTRTGFAANEVEILNLVDAVNTYFDARARYLELLHAAWLESAELRRTAGIPLLIAQPRTIDGATP